MYKDETTNEIKPIFSLLSVPEKTKVKSERADIIRQFMEEINKERIGTKWKPMTGRGIAIKVGHLKDNKTLYYFLSQCKRYKNEGKGGFSKCFFGSLKIK